MNNFFKINYVRDIIDILDHKDRIGFFILLLLIFIGAIFETLSIALIIPLLKVIIDGDIYAGGFIKNNYFDITGISLQEISTADLITIVILFILIIFFLKFLYLVYLSWLNSRYNSGILYSTSIKLFKKYVNNSYSFHVNNNSGKLIENVNGEVNLYCGSVISPFFILITEILILFFLFALVLYVDFFSGIIVTVLIFFVASIYYLFTKKKIDKWGNLRQKHALLRMQHLQQGFFAIKDIKLFKSENYFIEKFINQTDQIKKVMQNSMFVISIPRLGLEFLLVIGMSLFLMLNSIDDETIKQNIPTLGLFAAASFRILPSINRILASLQNLRYAYPVVKRLKDHLKVDENYLETKKKNITFNKDLTFENVNFYYHKDKNILENFNFKINIGENLGIIGLTGSGKTTLLNLMLGLIKPTKGRILSDNNDIQENLNIWYDIVSFVPQSIYLTDDSIKNNIAFGVKDTKINHTQLYEAIKLANLKNLIDELKDGYETFVGERGVKLSGGQIQRIGIARALYKKPEILILDEPTSALDSNTEQKIINEVNKIDNIKTKILISHRTGPLELCDKIIKIDKGNLRIIK